MRRHYLREAAIMLVLARLALRLVAPARLLARASRPPRRVRRFAGEDVRWVAWAVETIGDRRWMQAPALPRALAAQTMLRRRGIASRLCLGVARERGTLAAHAWIEVGQEMILGGDGAGEFQPGGRSSAGSAHDGALAAHERHRRAFALRRRPGGAARPRTRGECAQARMAPIDPTWRSPAVSGSSTC